MIAVTIIYGSLCVILGYALGRWHASQGIDGLLRG